MLATPLWVLGTSVYQIKNDTNLLQHSIDTQQPSRYATPTFIPSITTGQMLPERDTNNYAQFTAMFVMYLAETQCSSLTAYQLSESLRARLFTPACVFIMACSYYGLLLYPQWQIAGFYGLFLTHSHRIKSVTDTDAHDLKCV